MTIYHLIDALPAAFFGLLGIWAAVVRRHWFLRFSVVCTFLLVCLLIPAYEVVIEFGIAISLIMAGVWLARGRRHKSVRFSLESALLAMVVVAIGSAVIAKAPEFGWVDWLNLLGIGAFVALISLHCLWLVFGQASLWRRLPMSLLGFLVYTALYYFSSATHHLLVQPKWSYAWAEKLWQRVSDPAILSWGLSHCIPTSLLGFSTLCLALVLARGSRWFTLANAEQSKPLNKRNSVARLGLVTLMLCIFLPMCYLFYRLMTPTPYPVVEIPVDNGWDDLVAAGNICNSENDYLVALQTARTGTQAEAKAAIDHVLPVLDRIDLGIGRRGFTVDPHHAEEDIWSIIRAYYCLQSQFFYIERFGTPKDQIIQSVKLLYFVMLVNKDVGIKGMMVGNYVEVQARLAIARMLVGFNAEQCQQIVKLLYQYDSKRDLLESRLYNQRLADENSGWMMHLRLLMQDWSGEDPYARESQEYLFTIRHTRMLIVQFALQRYFLENQRLPEKLSELVPKYLPAILFDPHSQEPFHYQRLWGGYALTTQDEETEDRALVTGPAAPYFWQRLQESWQSFQKAIAALPRNAR